MSMHYNIKLVTQWAEARNLIDGSTPKNQFIKGVEENGEVFEALLKRDKDLLVDAVGDTLVVLTILCLQSNLDPATHIKRHGTQIDDCDMSSHTFSQRCNSRLTTHVALSMGMSFGKLARSIGKGEKISDDVTSIVSHLSQLCELCYIDFDECYRVAYEEIKHRTGRMVDGVFVKDE